MSDDYRPISCDTHSQLEILVMHRQEVRLVWDEDGLTHTEAVLPMDVQTRAGAEYLELQRRDGQRHSVRLDRIRSFEPVTRGG